jgi:hypothetical protein
MAKGISVHIGVGEVNPSVYDGNSLRVKTAESDSKAMREIAVGNGFEVRGFLISEDAKRDAVRSALIDACKNLDSGGLFLLTFAGHGFQRERDGGGFTESWALYDAQMIDDELSGLLRGFDANARIVVVSESCRSGGILDRTLYELRKSIGGFRRWIAGEKAAQWIAGEKAADKRSASEVSMSADLIEWLMRRNAKEYARVEKEYAVINRKKLSMGIVLLAACRKNQNAYFSERHGLFTEALLKVWSNGGFMGDYGQLYQKILVETAGDHYRQKPDCYKMGEGAQALLQQRPFTI